MNRDINAFRKLAPAAQVAALRGEHAKRSAQIDRASDIDEKARTVWLSIASEYPVERWFGIERLKVDREAIRTERLDAGIAFLVGHDPADQVGVVEDYRITPDRKLRVLARFGKSARAEEIWQDVLGGIRKNASFAYVIHDLVLEKQEGDVNTYRVTDFELLEASLVSIPADPSVGVGRAHQFTKGKAMTEVIEEGDGLSRRERRAAKSGDGEDRTGEAERVKSLLAAGREFKDQGGLELAMKLIEDPSASMETFRAQMLASMRGKQTPTATAQPFDFAPGHPGHFGDGARVMLPTPKYFKGPNAQERAYESGMFLKGQLFGDPKAAAWCKQRGIEIRAMSAQVGSQGGYLVPDALSSTIIDLAEEHGVFRKEADLWTMGTDTLSIPRSTSDPTANFVGENSEISDSTPGWGMVNLSAKKIAAMVRMSTELVEDAVIDVADRTALQIGRAFAKKEDQCGWLGDGTSTYGGMRGISHLVMDGSHNAAKVTAAANHDTFQEVDATDLGTLIAAIPEYAASGAKFYCSHKAWGLVFARLMAAAGGNAISDLAGEVRKSYLGYPVVVSQVLPSVATTLSGLPMLFFGNLRQCGRFGARRDIRILLLNERYAEFDQIAVQATERFDIVNSDVGDNTDAGPMVALIGA